MDARRWMGWGLLVLCTACSGAKQAVREPSDPGTGGSGAQAQSELESRRYVDQALGFELIQPGGDWILDEPNEQTPEGLVIPIALRHTGTGAQILMQVAPDVATPTEFAERLTLGLRSQPGFLTSEVQPLPMSDSAVGFDFVKDGHVYGRVMVRDGSPGHIFMMLATWPATAPDEVPRSVNALFESVRPLPVAPHQT